MVSKLKVAALAPLGFVKEIEVCYKLILKRSEMKCASVKEGIASLIQVE